MERIPLAPGLSTPDFVEGVLSVFGKNPHGEPNYRLIWSERKRIFFMGEVVPEYIYLPCPCWVLERWLPPDKDAGSEIMWGVEMTEVMGPYPRHGTYMFAQGFPSDWYPNETSVAALAAGLQASTDIPMKQRLEAIKTNLEHKQKQDIGQVAGAIVELQDSASSGRLQQAVSGPKNNFRTPEDFERDQNRVLTTPLKLPKRGGKVY